MLLVSASVAAVLTIGALSSALPSSPATSSPGERRRVSVNQVRNPNFAPVGPVQLAKVYRKYGRPLPADLKTALENILDKRSTGSAVTKPEANDVEYLTPVLIGTPGQELNLDLDTGSSDLWVFSSETQKSQVKGQTVYDPNESSTAEKLEGYSWQISYGDGSSSSGVVYLDHVTIGGLKVSSQAVEAATSVSREFTSDPNNHGLVGLGFSSLNMVQPQSQKTFFDNVMQDLESPVFTADLKAGAPGYYNFGFIDPSAYTGNITYVPADSSDGYWAWTTSGYAVGSGDFQNTAFKSIVDTGTSLLLLPISVVSAYYGKVNGATYDVTQGAYILPCTGSPPDFSFGVGDDGTTITVPGSYIQYASISSSGQTCFGGIQVDPGSGFAIFGDVALKAAFVVFDGGKKRIGWASKHLS